MWDFASEGVVCLWWSGWWWLRWRRRRQRWRRRTCIVGRARRTPRDAGTGAGSWKPNEQATSKQKTRRARPIVKVSEDSQVTTRSRCRAAAASRQTTPPTDAAMTTNSRLRTLLEFAREHGIALLVVNGVDGGAEQTCAISEFALGSTADDIALLVRGDKIMLHASALTLEDVRARISVPADVFCNPAPVGSVDSEAALDFKLEAVRKMLAASPGCVVPTADGGLRAAADAVPLLRAAFEGDSLPPTRRRHRPRRSGTGAAPRRGRRRGAAAWRRAGSVGRRSARCGRGCSGGSTARPTAARTICSSSRRLG